MQNRDLISWIKICDLWEIEIAERIIPTSVAAEFGGSTTKDCQSYKEYECNFLASQAYIDLAPGRTKLGNGLTGRTTMFRDVQFIRFSTNRSPIERSEPDWYISIYTELEGSDDTGSWYNTLMNGESVYANGHA